MAVKPAQLAGHGLGAFALWTFIVAYLFVMTEEFTHLRKSKPVLLAAGAMWALIAWVGAEYGMSAAVEEAFRHNMLDYAELFLFLLVAMTYINTLDERQVFQALRSWLVRTGFGYRKLFWLTGVLAFFISPVADNMTTALLMCAVVMAVGKDNNRFVSLSCINIVVAANAGGAFSPFGDITTLMVWQKGVIPFSGFFPLFFPSLVNWLVPCAIMHFAVPNERPKPSDEVVQMRRGAKRAIFLFLLTIITSVLFHQYLHLPPVAGMMLGLAYVQFLGFYLKTTSPRYRKKHPEHPHTLKSNEYIGDIRFDIFRELGRAEWDTLMFFYGVILCVGGLGFLGYLAHVSQVMYVDWSPTWANISVGLVSAVVDNIPVMFAILTMMPAMDAGQWLLVTMTAGVGGSLLSIGSAAGVALMGQARGKYTFFSHLKWTPAVALGYAASIGLHMLINSHLFNNVPIVAR
ncbi:MAG: sodium:proton antiporter NhaD [Magnetococcales bacterium]|nr:sodium:proton antiporter NhaD [Magnetococcales bacterium]MBF0321845.1 sodium:proton antiporter NhaD [Magnetococcales bacterium]